MYVLHVSDLHVTIPGETLESLWLGAAAALPQREFDAIVVSGDLTQAGGDEEYAKLARFLDAEFLPLLAKRERRRIILVPGNHDVDWSADVGSEPVSFASACREPAGIDKLKIELAGLRAHPERSPLRVRHSALGHVEYVRVRTDSPAYRGRLRRSHEFLSEFFGQARGGDKRFDLLTPGKDWSAHVFAEEGIAFFGFNSCHQNDAWWTGATIDNEAIVAAKGFREKRCKNLLCVAVWHHGLTAERGRPDLLTLQDIGRLRDAGFKIGMHGHTHRAEAEVLPLLRDRIAIVATGSLGAGPSDRPDAVGHQFSTIDLFPSRLVVRLYERQGPSWQFAASQTWPVPLFHPDDGGTRVRATARRHRRRWLVDPEEARARRHRRSLQPNGVARVDVELTDLQFEGDLPLAVLTPPFCSTLTEPASVDGNLVEVRPTEEPDGVRRFVLTASGSREVRTLTWKYWVSNAVALNRAELDLLEARRPWFPNVKPHQDIRSHVVRFDCDLLELELEFAADSEPFARDAEIVVERKVERAGQRGWTRVAAEENRCQLLSASRRKLVLRVPAPVVGYRYGIAFEPGLPGTPMSDGARGLGKRLLERCQDTRPTPNSLGPALTQIIRAAIHKALGTDDQPLIENGSWTGLLWHSDRRRLLPAFGEFFPRLWGNRFACGTGVAGHAFRMSRTTAWAGGRDPASVIYQENVEPSAPAPDRSPPYKWILCVPIFLAPKGPSIGVVGFASHKTATKSEKALHDIVERIHDDSPRQQDLETAVNAAFWQAIAFADFEEVLAVDRELAEEVRGALFGRAKK